MIIVLVFPVGPTVVEWRVRRGGAGQNSPLIRFVPRLLTAPLGILSHLV